jgi:hypothetical protein
MKALGAANKEQGVAEMPSKLQFNRIPLPCAFRIMLIQACVFCSCTFESLSPSLVTKKTVTLDTFLGTVYGTAMRPVIISPATAENT